MIVLGIDPGTAALGYGIIERTGGRLREVDHGCLVTSPDLPLPERLLAIHTLIDELLRSTGQASIGRRAAVLLQERPDGVRGRAGARGRPPRGRAVRRPGPRGDPERGQERGRGLRRGRQGPGRADGPAGPGHGRAAAAGRCRRRPGDRHLGRQHRTPRADAHRRRDGPGGDRADRSAPRTRYDRAVREALRAWNEPPSAPRPDRDDGRRDRLGRGHGRRGRLRLARHRGRRDRLSRVRGPRDHRLGADRVEAQAPHLPPRPRGPAGAVRVPFAR